MSGPVTGTTVVSWRITGADGWTVAQRQSARMHTVSFIPVCGKPLYGPNMTFGIFPQFPSPLGVSYVLNEYRRLTPRRGLDTINYYSHRPSRYGRSQPEKPKEGPSALWTQAQTEEDRNAQAQEETPQESP